MHMPSKGTCSKLERLCQGKTQAVSELQYAVDVRNVYLVIGGATDGSIAFWDLTGSVEAFMERVSTLHAENFLDCQKQPRTGRGSQGGRWWRASSGSEMSSKSNRSERSTSASSQALHADSEELKVNTNDTPFEISEISPLHVLKNVHQSGVNGLHVSDTRDCPNTNSAFQYNVISGGDDQALNCVRFEVLPLSKNSESDLNVSEREVSTICFTHHDQDGKNSHCNEFERRLRFLNRVRVASARSSAVKGVWADKAWVVSTGLDQQVRCWHLEEDGKLREHFPFDRHCARTRSIGRQSLWHELLPDCSRRKRFADDRVLCILTLIGKKQKQINFDSENH